MSRQQYKKRRKICRIKYVRDYHSREANLMKILWIGIVAIIIFLTGITLWTCEHQTGYIARKFPKWLQYASLMIMCIPLQLVAKYFERWNWPRGWDYDDRIMEKQHLILRKVTAYPIYAILVIEAFFVRGRFLALYYNIYNMLSWVKVILYVLLVLILAFTFYIEFAPIMSFGGQILMILMALMMLGSLNLTYRYDSIQEATISAVYEEMRGLSDLDIELDSGEYWMVSCTKDMARTHKKGDKVYFVYSDGLLGVHVKSIKYSRDEPSWLERDFGEPLNKDRIHLE